MLRFGNNNFYGLLTQRGPWQDTAIDRERREQSRNNPSHPYKGEIPDGGLEHAGHGNWSTTFNPYPQYKTIPPLPKAPPYKNIGRVIKGPPIQLTPGRRTNYMEYHNEDFYNHEKPPQVEPAKINPGYLTPLDENTPEYPERIFRTGPFAHDMSLAEEKMNNSSISASDIHPTHVTQTTQNYFIHYPPVPTPPNHPRVPIMVSSGDQTDYSAEDIDNLEADRHLLEHYHAIKQSAVEKGTQTDVNLADMTLAENTLAAFQNETNALVLREKEHQASISTLQNQLENQYHISNEYQRAIEHLLHQIHAGQSQIADFRNFISYLPSVDDIAQYVEQIARRLLLEHLPTPTPTPQQNLIEQGERISEGLRVEAPRISESHQIEAPKLPEFQPPPPQPKPKPKPSHKKPPNRTPPKEHTVKKKSNEKGEEARIKALKNHYHSLKNNKDLTTSQKRRLEKIESEYHRLTGKYLSK